MWRDFEANRGTAPRRSPERRQQAEALCRVGLGSASQRLQGTTCRSHRITQNHAESHSVNLDWHKLYQVIQALIQDIQDVQALVLSCLDKSSPCSTWQPDGLSVLGHFGRAQLWLRSSRTTCTLDRKHKRYQNVQMSPGCRGRQWLTNQTTTYDYWETMRRA